MNFRKIPRDEPEINLIPFIDVLLVILIFLMLSTTYARYTELQITLPTASADRAKEKPTEVVVAVSADGRYSINKKPVDGRSPDSIAAELTAAAGGNAEAVVIISADASASHQSVVNVMDAARRAGLPKLTFAAQLPGGEPR